MASPNLITGRQAVVQIIGAGGPVDIGKYEEVSFTLDTETETYEPVDGYSYEAIVGPRISGSLKRGKIDGSAIATVLSHAKPGIANPPRYVIIYTDTSGTKHTLTDVTWKKYGITLNKGIIKEDLDFKAVDII